MRGSYILDAVVSRRRSLEWELLRKAISWSGRNQASVCPSWRTNVVGLARSDLPPRATTTSQHRRLHRCILIFLPCNMTASIEFHCYKGVAII